MNALHNMVAGQPRLVAPRACRETHLGGQHDPIPPALDGLTNNLLGAAIGIDIGGIDKITAGIEEALDHPFSLIGGRCPFALLAEDHRAQAKIRDQQTAVTQSIVFHL
jgi:hypothetical protein